MPQSAILLPTSSQVIAWPSSSPIVSPFGSSLPSRAWSDVSRGYRYGFNGQEIDGELGEYYAFEFRLHDSKLGRFLSIDPLLKLYPANSTYAFAQNRVIDGADLEGKEWSQSTNVYTDGWKVVDRTITIKVVNSSSIKDQVKITAYMNGIKTQAETSFSGEYYDTKTVYKTTVKYEIVDESKLNANDKFVMKLVDQIPGTDDKTAGRATLGGSNSNTIYVNLNIQGQAEGELSQVSRSGAHEIGHSGGLDHPTLLKGTDPNLDPYKDNLMRQTMYTTGTEITQNQQKTISDEIAKDNPRIPQVIKPPSSSGTDCTYNAPTVTMVQNPKNTTNYVDKKYKNE